MDETFWATYGTVLIFSALVGGAISGGLSSWLARTKGRDPEVWFAIGFCCGPIGILAVGLSPTLIGEANDGAESDDSNSSLPSNKTCPRCNEQVKFKAIVCRYCGNNFGEEAVLESVARHQKEAEDNKQKLEAEKVLHEKLQREKKEQERLAADLSDPSKLLNYIRFTDQPSTQEVMNYLVKFIRAGAAINHKSQIRRVTPLHCAVVHQNEGLVKLLLNNGAIVNATDIFGKTPFDFAIRRKNPIIADIIYRAGGKSGKDFRRAQSEASKLASTINFICKNCKKELTVSAKYGGRSGTCDYCGAMMRVPYIRPKLAALAKNGSLKLPPFFGQVLSKDLSA